MIKMNGVINVLKPPGMTSHDVISFLRRIFAIKKIGHAGTLDPQAAGVLPVCLGQATRLLEFLNYDDKEYVCHMTFGSATTTQDAWGEITETHDPGTVTLDKIKENIIKLTGEIEQIVPMYSAVKVRGEALYKKARRGEKAISVAKRVYIDEFRVLDFQPPVLSFFVRCSKGTYIRTLCHDLGNLLGVGGHLSFLLRNRVGSFTLEQSVTLEEITVSREKVVLPLDRCRLGLPDITLPPEELDRLHHGRAIVLQGIVPGDSKQGPIAVYDEKENLQAIGEITAADNRFLLKPKKVFNW